MQFVITLDNIHSQLSVLIMDSEWRQKVLYNRRCREFVANWLGSDFNTLFSDQRPQKRKRPGVVYSRRAKTPDEFTTTAWMQLIRNPLTRQRGSYFSSILFVYLSYTS